MAYFVYSNHKAVRFFEFAPPTPTEKSAEGTGIKVSLLEQHVGTSELSSFYLYELSRQKTGDKSVAFKSN